MLKWDFSPDSDLGHSRIEKRVSPCMQLDPYHYHLVNLKCISLCICMQMARYSSASLNLFLSSVNSTFLRFKSKISHSSHTCLSWWQSMDVLALCRMRHVW